MNRKYIVGLDIGTTKICAAVAAVEPAGPNIVGIGTVPSAGIKKGVVVDMDQTTEAIMAAIADAGAASSIEIKAAYVGVTGSHIKCEKSYGATGIKGSEVTNDDISRVIDAAASVYVPLDREVLHVMPTDFVIDGQDGIVRPLGMSCTRMEANVRIITASQAALENIVKCCRRVGVEVLDAVFEPIASAKAVATQDELTGGVAVIDIGGGTADIAVYREGGFRHASVLPVGGNHLTNDVAVGLKLPMKEAERVKKQHGFALGLQEMGHENIEVRSMNSELREVPLRSLGSIIRPRCEEMLRLLRREVESAGLYSSPACIVLTGGTAMLPGIDRVAEAVFGLPVRLGVPENCYSMLLKDAIMSPTCSTVAGLVLHGYAEEMQGQEGVFDGLVQIVKGTTKNLLEVKGWGFLKKAQR